VDGWCGSDGGRARSGLKMEIPPATALGTSPPRQSLRLQLVPAKAPSGPGETLRMAPHRGIAYEHGPLIGEMVIFPIFTLQEPLLAKLLRETVVVLIMSWCLLVMRKHAN
jgi:hypothetical protein